MITEFHDIVSHGPMYICTCCDQLWYKHSVTKVDNRKTANPNYKTDQVSFKVCYQNARSLHKHIDDIRHDFNFTNTDINIFSETRCMRSDDGTMYDIDAYTLFRNDGHNQTFWWHGSI